MRDNFPGVIGVPNQAKLDSLTWAMAVLSYEHYEVHGGSSFIAEINDFNLADAATLIMAFKTGNTAGKWAHPVPLVSSSGGAHLEILRAPTITVDTGSQIDIFNRNENSSKQSEFTTIETTPQAHKVTKDPTITADGVVIGTVAMGQGNNRQPGTSRDVLERVLLPNTIYAYRIISKAANNVCQLSLVWYEHTNKT